MKLSEAVVAQYAERARRTEEVLGVEKRRYERAVEALRDADRGYNEAKHAATAAERDCWAVDIGWIPLKDGTWLFGDYAERHPEEFRGQYLYELEEE